MDYKVTAKKIVDGLGGKDNVKTITHCMTRLRVMLVSRDKVDEESIKAVKGVKGTIEQGGMYQVIIGPEVEQLFVEVSVLLPNSEIKSVVVESEKKNEGKKNPLNEVFPFISGCITPTLPVLLASGLISAILALLTNFGVLTNEMPTYLLLNTLANSAYSYLPVLIAITGARRLKTNEFVAAFIILGLCSPAISGVEGLSFLGFSLMTVRYTSNIVPALLMVPVMAFLDKYLVKYVPNAVKTIIRPFILVIVMFPLTLVILGPIGTIVGNALAQFCIWVTSFGWISMSVLSALHPLLVMVGMHTVITPLIINEITTVGSSLLFSKALAANLAIGGAALAVGIKAKKNENKESGISTGITALLSVTEPALYGVLIRLKKPLISAIIASGITGIFIGLFDIRAYATASTSFLTLPIFMGGEMSNFYLACAAAVIATVLGFIITWIIGFDE